MTNCERLLWTNLLCSSTPTVIERATISISEVLDPFDDVAQGFVPAEGSRVVMLTVQFENTGPGPYEIRPDQLVLQDADGYLWSPTPVQRPPDIAIPDLQYVQIAPGDRVSGMIGYQVPIDSGIAHVILTPESSRLLVVANVGTEPVAAAGIGDEVTYETADGAGQGVVSVTEVQDPFDDFPEGRDPQEGARYVLVTVTMENTGAAPLEVRPGSLLIHDSNGYLRSNSTVPRGTDIVIPDLQGQQLAPGSRISGVVGFQVPLNADVAEIMLQPENGRLIVLAELDTVN